MENNPQIEMPDFLGTPEKRLQSYIKDVTNSTQLISNQKQNENIKVTNKSDIITLLDDYWKTLNLSSNFQTGVILGKGDATNVNIKEFFKKFKICIETIVRTELSKQDKTSEEFKDDFKALESVLLMICSHMERTEIKLDNEKMLAVLNGFINSYITSIRYV